MFKQWTILILMSGVFGLNAQGINTPAPDLTGKSLDNQVVRLADFKGKVVLLDFWASWCGPCREEMPFLVELHRSWCDSGLAVLAVNIDKDSTNIVKFLNALKEKPAFTILWDKTATLPPPYKLEGMPTTVIIDRSGIVRFRHMGFKSENKMKYVTEIKMLLDQKTEAKP
jgi:thiol-disulfide isomerase/thioredoxin